MELDHREGNSVQPINLGRVSVLFKGDLEWHNKIHYNNIIKILLHMALPHSCQWFTLITCLSYLLGNDLMKWVVFLKQQQMRNCSASCFLSRSLSVILATNKVTNLSFRNFSLPFHIHVIVWATSRPCLGHAQCAFVCVWGVCVCEREREISFKDQSASGCIRRVWVLDPCCPPAIPPHTLCLFVCVYILPLWQHNLFQQTMTSNWGHAEEHRSWKRLVRTAGLK